MRLDHRAPDHIDSISTTFVVATKWALVCRARTLVIASLRLQTLPSSARRPMATTAATAITIQSRRHSSTSNGLTFRHANVQQRVTSKRRTKVSAPRHTYVRTRTTTPRGRIPHCNRTLLVLASIFAPTRRQPWTSLMDNTHTHPPSPIT